MANPILAHFQKYHPATLLVKSGAAVLTILIAIFLFIWPIVGLSLNCFYTVRCTLFNALGFIQLFVFIPLWLASWVSPKIGSLTLLAWCIFCTFATFFSIFGGWRTIGATMGNILCLAMGVGMVVVDVYENQKTDMGYERNDFGDYEEDLG